MVATPWLRWPVAGYAAWVWLDLLLGRDPGMIEALGGAAVFGAIAYSVADLSSQGLLRARTRGPATGRRVAVTFDDGPDPETTPGVMATLAKHGVRSTFFVLGEKVRQHPALARELIDAGHEVASHSDNHRWQSFLTPWKARAVLERAQRAITHATGKKPRWFRPPYGVTVPGLVPAVQTLRTSVVGWSLRTRDGTGVGDPAARVAWTLSRVRPGEIILLHDAPEAFGGRLPLGPAMLDGLLTGLRDKGFTAVTVSELLDA